ncbi:hypothetical protein GCM10023096_09650 [Nonomuraea ferruginea]
MPGGTLGGRAVRDAVARAGGLSADELCEVPLDARAGPAAGPATHPAARGTAAATAAQGFNRIAHTYQSLDQPQKRG